MYVIVIHISILFLQITRVRTLIPLDNSVLPYAMYLLPFPLGLDPKSGTKQPKNIFALNIDCQVSNLKGPKKEKIYIRNPL